MKRDGFFALALTAAAVLAACESSPTPQPAPPVPPTTAPPASPPPPPSVGAPPMSLPPAEPVSKDSCGADLLAGLVGKPRTEIPVPVDPSRRRVVCTGCPRTMDFRPDRLTIEYDQTTNLVTGVMCG